MRSGAAGVICLAGLTLAAQSGCAGKPAERLGEFRMRTVTVDRIEYKYQVYLPPGWTQDKTWPVILFLHGAGERGSDGLRQTEAGLPRAIRNDPSRFPAVVVTPQCRERAWWPEPAMEKQAMAALDAAAGEFHGDAARTYLTGLSMGGYGTWSFATHHPDRFAALAVVCGGLRVPPKLIRELEISEQPELSAEDVAKAIGKTPVWVFHGSEDERIPVGESRRIVAALQNAGGRVKYTEYPGVPHNSWDLAYGERDFTPWLFAAKR